MDGTPSWDVTHFDCDNNEASFAIRSDGKLFLVYVRVEDLVNWPRKREFLRLIQEALEDYDAEEALYNLISDACIAMLRAHRSRSIDPLQFTLQQYYVPETLFFKFISEGDGLTHLAWVKDRPDPPGIAPLIPLSSIPDPFKLPHFDASIIKILPRYSSNANDVLSDTPGTVILNGDTARYHFKAAQDHTSFLREFKILLEIKQGLLNQEHRLPSIHGLVYYENEPHQVLGMLVEYIDNEGTLASYIGTDRITHSVKQRWERQIMETVLSLHRHGIVWGDVKPDNVLIDSNENTCLIDFGGGFNSAYVDEDVIETVEGDMQGVSKIIKALYSVWVGGRSLAIAASPSVQLSQSSAPYLRSTVVQSG